VKNLSIIILLVFIIFPGVHVFAQDDEESLNQFNFFFSPIAEIVLSRTSPAFGGGALIGSDDPVSIGVRVLYLADKEAIHSLEISVFLRLYFSDLPQGPFIQISTGTVILARDTLTLPEDFGVFTAGFHAGWRFLFAERFFIEPVIRTGFPYYLGGGLCAGVRF